jgi:hypothetical protein
MATVSEISGPPRIESCAQPGRTNARIAIANARLIIIGLTYDAGAGMPIIRIILMSRHSSAAT